MSLIVPDSTFYNGNSFYEHKETGFYRISGEKPITKEEYDKDIRVIQLREAMKTAVPVNIFGCGKDNSD